MTFQTAWITAVVALLVTGKLQARDYLRISDPDFRPYPLAVPEFKDITGEAKAEALAATKAMRFDLDVAGMFQLLDPRSYITDPRHEGMSGATIKFTDWMNVGAEGLVKATLSRSPGELILEFSLFEVVSGKELLSETVKGKPTELRAMVHGFADAIQRYYTGHPSVFFTRIVFARRLKNDSKEICVMDFDGHNEICPVKNGSLNVLPSWAKDGSGFYYSSYRDHDGPFLYFHALASGKSRCISRQPGFNIGAKASPDGGRIALSLGRDGNSELYVMNADGSDHRRLTRETWASDLSPTWSPDSSQLAFVSDRSGNPQIYTMGADGSGPRRITFRGNYNQMPDWSPRGDSIVFTARDERLGFDIFTVNPFNGDITRLTQDQGLNEGASYSPDGNLLVFSSNRSGAPRLYLMNGDGSRQRLISRGRGAYNTPAWGPWRQANDTKRAMSSAIGPPGPTR